ncbi:RNA polymerase II degradation factor 1-like [Amphibalanus amphitrite]|uniref:RNA polymerase II degradation factor 1-like n=1 Tax=Amphibalanus amphitrite TaxID=1232801 RepID=UPI001C91B504|nr:RNA polymerase II degradation factor 1-like [Amphibalanus amphitrite]
MRPAQIMIRLLCLTAVVCSVAAAAAVRRPAAAVRMPAAAHRLPAAAARMSAAAARMPAAAVRMPAADQMAATSTETSVVSAPTEAEARSIRPAGGPRHRVKQLKQSHAMRWVGFGTPPTLWKVPKPPVTPAWRFEPSVSSGSSFWPNIMHAMGDHPQKTASDKPETKTATAAAGAAKSASAAVTAKSAASADSKVSRLNALTSNTYQPDAGTAVGSDWVATQVARPAAARRATETSTTSGTESATQGPAAVTSTSATARRGQQSGGWLRVFSVQPPTDDTAAADSATDRQDLGEDTEGSRRPRGPPTQQYRAEYVVEPPAGGAVIDSPQQFPVQQVPSVPQHRPGRRQPPRRGFMDNMLTRLFGSSSPQLQRQRPGSHRPSAHRQRPAPQQQFRQQSRPAQQQQQNNLPQLDNFQDQEKSTQQQNNSQQQTAPKQQQEPQQRETQQQETQQQENTFQQQHQLFQQPQLENLQQFTQQQLDQPPFGQQQFAGAPFSVADQFSPSVPVGADPTHFRPVQVTKQQQPLQQRPRQPQPQQYPETESGFSVSSQFPHYSPAAAGPASVDAVEQFEPVRLAPVGQSLNDSPASRTAALTAAYLQNPQSGTRRDDDTTSDDDVVELVIEYDNDLEGIVDELLREVRGRSGGGERAAADREPEPAASQLRRRPFTVQQLDQRLGLAHQPYYHIAMALHGLTQGQSRR